MPTRYLKQFASTLEKREPAATVLEGISERNVPHRSKLLCSVPDRLLKLHSIDEVMVFVACLPTWACSKEQMLSFVPKQVNTVLFPYVS
jgi:hypothetical protein